MFEQAFKRIDTILRQDDGCSTELDYIEQTSWLLFLKYLDALELDRAKIAELHGQPHTFLLEKRFRWHTWAMPLTAAGTLDHNRALIGDDLCEFVDQKLLPYLRGFKQRADSPNTIEYKIGEIFGELKNKLNSGYNLREVIELVDTLRFNSQTEKHELSELYESKIRKMGNAGRNGGEYYTPRPLIRAMLAVVQPSIGETIYDGALGSAGFLCESFTRMNEEAKTVASRKKLQTSTFFGQEKKSLPFAIGLMNMILHGVDAPNILHINTLEQNNNDIEEKDRHHVILANPPFGGSERPEVQQNFPIKTSETAFLFLQHFIRKLKAGGRAGIVIKNTFLSNTDNASVSLRKLLLETCTLHTVLDCPGGTFQGAGVKTVVLFFIKGSPTRKVWFYQLNPGRNLGKTNPLNDDDLADFVKRQKTLANSPQSWSVKVATVVDGEVEEGRRYVEADFNQSIEIKEREEARVNILMSRIDQREKTLVFCRYQPHAAFIRDLINQKATNKDPLYCCRVTANDGALGDQYLREFQDNEKAIPTILTTSQKLSTGVDARNIRNIVLLRPINSMIEFKQIIGRGTRLYDGKDFFTIYDFVRAHHHFNDPEWDGEPLEPEPELEPGPRPAPPGPAPESGPDGPEPSRRLVIKLADGKAREIQYMTATSFWSADGRPMSANQFLESLFGALPEFFKNEDELRAIWSKPDTRRALLRNLEDKGFDRTQLTEIQRALEAEQSDLYDVLAYIAFALPRITRQERADRARPSIHASFAEKQRAFLDFVLSHYVAEGFEELDREKLAPLLELRYNALSDAILDLGPAPEIGKMFVNFQQYLY